MVISMATSSLFSFSSTQWLPFSSLLEQTVIYNGYVSPNDSQTHKMNLLYGCYIYCAVNFSSDSIPNGIGFGRRANHFGLFLSESFDEGHSYSCTTFTSPCPGKTNKVIECWGVVRKDKQEKLQVLERFKEDRHMLNMVGVANASE